MKCFFSFFKNNLKSFFLIVVCGNMMAAVMYLNHIPSHEILYGILLCASFLFLTAAGSFYGYRKKYQRLSELGKSVTISLDEMPKTNEGIEAQYQNLIRTLFWDKTRMENEAVMRERDLMEYYTMWVHQIKTPIAALKLLLQEKDGQLEMTEEIQELFRIEQYVEMALQYMRLGAESNDFVLKRIKLDDIIRGAVHKYARQFISKKISLKYEAVDTVVLSDEKWLEFVVEQLLSNALKYTVKGSISIYTEQGCLVIADTGIGIRSEDLPRVCEKGYTGYNGHADKRSTGIGLYLCSRILKKLGHKLVITSEEGAGTRVVIAFPEQSLDTY